jgi:REP element-mobilizing transposase RayT
MFTGMRQLTLFKQFKNDYGGELLRSRAGRMHGRPLSSRSTMHLVLRSTQARGDWSFRRPGNARRVRAIVSKFAAKYGVRLISFANVGNHLHLHIKLSNRFSYAPFIRAVTSAIVMAVTGRTRWTKKANGIVSSYREYLNLSDYIQLNRWEGQGYRRDQTQFFIKKARDVLFEVRKLARLRQPGSHATAT